MALSLLAADQPAATEKQLQAALHSEIVLGDLTGAIDQYRAILARPGTPRTLAARALLRMGDCHEKLGHRSDADNLYRRVITEFSDQREIAEKAAARSGPRNLKFEAGLPGKVPADWFVPSLPKDADYVAQLQRAGCRPNSTGCVVVMVQPNAPQPSGNRPVGTLMQVFSAAAYRGKTVRLSAWMRLESFYSTATSFRVPDAKDQDRAQMWLNVERPLRRNGFSDNMDDRPVLSSEWKRCEIVGEIDEDAQFIDIGVMSIGGGRVWVDDVSFEVIPKPAGK